MNDEITETNQHAHKVSRRISDGRIAKLPQIFNQMLLNYQNLRFLPTCWWILLISPSNRNNEKKCIKYLDARKYLNE